MKNGKSVMIVGVGGQGTLLASRLLGAAMVAEGYDVKVSEVHGMSQRGGSVVTYVRYGEKVYSPIIEEGEADIVLAFEQLEAARYLPVVTGSTTYPEGLLEDMKKKGARVLALDALSLAEEAGSAKAVNVVLIGAMAKSLGGEQEVWLKAIEETVPAKFLEMNRKAFALGWQAV